MPAHAGAGQQGRAQTVETHEACVPSVVGIPASDDSDPLAYYSPANPQGSIKVAGHGVLVTVTGDDGNDLAVDVVNPPSKGRVGPAGRLRPE